MKMSVITNHAKRYGNTELHNYCINLFIDIDINKVLNICPTFKQ